jgi:N-acetylated-alpha-linked acidic dipeptidase
MGMTELIETLCSAVDAGTMMGHLQEFARRVKLSGTPEELESFRYLRARLDEYGYSTELIMHPAFISLPGAARLELGNHSPRCITHAMSRSSAPGGTRGHVVYAGRGAEQDFAARDVQGKIVLLDGMATPGAARRASLAGALGQIHISPHEHIHEMCISPVWGSPGAETLDQLPSTVVVSIALQDGEDLKSRLAAGETVEAVLHAEVDTGWRDTPILVAELMPDDASEDAPFVMFSGHHDTWYYGVMDNGGANATMLEVARLFAPHRAQWRRGLRLCFWSGHSHGRYSGSAWYADNHWSELSRRCAAHVNVDSTGARGNTVLADAPVSSELRNFAGECVLRRGGQELDGLRMPRAGDQSFWGIGVPSMFMGMGEQPASAGGHVTAGLFGSGTKGAGFGWWWHTPDDTIDKMDPEILVRDTQIYVETVGRLLTDAALPLDYAGHGTVLLGILKPLQASLHPGFDLTEAIGLTEDLVAAATAARQRAGDDAAVGRLNQALMRVSRAMVPIDYTTGDRFAHDPALPQSAYPVLDPVRRLADAPPGSARAHLAISARRAANRLVHALEEAVSALQSV